MAGDLILREPTLPGLVEGHEADKLAEAFCGMLNHEDGRRDEVCGADARLPTAAERRLLADRLRDVHAALRPVAESMTDKQKLAAALAAFFIGYPSLRNADAQETVAAYVMDLQEIPLFAIKAAFAEIKGGRVYDVDSRTQRRILLSPDYVPTSPRIGTVARKCAEPMAVKRLRLQTALAITRVAPEPLPPEKQHEMWNSIKKAMAVNSFDHVAELRKTEERRQRTLEESAQANERRVEEEWRSQGQEPMKSAGFTISPALAAKVAEWKKEDAERAAEETRTQRDRAEALADGTYGKRAGR